MRVFDGRAADIDADRERTRAMFDFTKETDEPAVRAWCPHRQVAFGRRDARADGYEEATRAAEDKGFPAVERAVGGRAVAYTGSTVAFARAEPTDGRAIQRRYDRASADLRRAFDRLGVEARPGEPPDSFCPGSHSLQANGKIAGLAQRVTDEGALVAGIVLTRDADAIADVLAPVYRALDVPFDPASVGSVERADGESEPATVADEIERALVEGYREDAGNRQD
ncbi:lipoyl protein ligase domain-containing protein [Halococcus thailandensis]|uniref:Biotin/lipoate A/B protein ligase n=1 Tax=Halococcus thailandensis JCM 13552 TaxID=1227457 RepID=M0N5F9_9EURY|nr:hypothetical protein [Halococcus thailandensis]EMA52359.1 biotin/lipoate A/B protein ligase [Halococcus thailandensis JCM 13552]